MKSLFALAVLFLSTPAAWSATLFENFDNVPGLSGLGWVIVNNSSPVGSTTWFQGNDSIFPAFVGAPNAYVAANFNAAGSGLSPNVSLWLISPNLTFNPGDVLSFYAGTESASPFLDILEVRFSTNGASSDVGATDTSVGDFSNVLTTINPVLAAWQSYSIPIPVGAPTSGRFAFRYVVSDTNTNGNYVGIDELSVGAAVPEPSTFAFSALALTALVGIGRRIR